MTPRFGRREFIAGGLAALAQARAAEDQTAIFTIRPDQAAGNIAPDFMGLGYEISSVARPGLLSERNAVYVQLVRTLGPRGVIRIGGNTSDYAHYSAKGEPVSRSNATVVNDAVLRDLGGFLRATGWRLIWGLNLGTGTPEEAVAEAATVAKYAGERLLAIEIGNEPDLFVRNKHRQTGWDYDDWLREYRTYKTALRDHLPGVPLAGPDAAVKTDWVTRFAAAEGSDAVLLTHHYYREGQNPASTIEKLLGPDPKLQPELERLREASQMAKKPYRICEVNSFSGGGRPGVSDTMAGALWALDYMLTLAMNGCAGVNMETGVNQLDFISSYSPIGDDEHGHYMARPEYYGMLAFALAAKGQLLKVEGPDGVDDVKAYAARPGAGRVSAVVINKHAEARTVSVKIAGGVKAKSATVVRLEAPAIDAKSGVTLGGAEVSASGAWKPARTEKINVADSSIDLHLPAYSAAVAQIEA